MGKLYCSLILLFVSVNTLFATDTTSTATLNGYITGGEAVQEGVLISITGLISVFAALATIALLISALPLLLSVLNKYVPEEAPHKKAPAKKSNDNGGSVALAIAAAFHKRNKG